MSVPAGEKQDAKALADLLSNILKSNVPLQAKEPPAGPAGPAAPDPPLDRGNLGRISAVLPAVMQAMSGKGELLRPEKINLIRAFRPYLDEERQGEIDHAIRMANVAQAAKTALSALGR